MAIRLNHPGRVWALAALLTVAAVVAALGAVTQVRPRSALLAQLQTPAVSSSTSVGPGPVSALIPAGSHSLRVSIGPNRASAPDRVSVAVSERGRVLDGAAVTVTYSMPSMNMYDAFTGRLPQTAHGIYSATEPVFGMPGVWQLRFRVVPTSGSPITVVVNDRMVG